MKIIFLLRFMGLNIFYTSDGGETWDKKEGNLPDLPVYNILQSPLDSDEVIIGTELGVWFTNNFSSDNKLGSSKCRYERLESHRWILEKVIIKYLYLRMV